MYYQVTDYYDPVGEKKIATKCPDCGHENCLELYFYQKRIETPFSKRISKKVTAILYCHYTQKEIPPVQWNDEIEHYFKTEKPKLKLQPRMLKFTKWFYAILSVPVLFALALFGYSSWQNNQYIQGNEDIAQVQVGNKAMVMLNIMEDNQTTAYGNTWVLAKKIEADTIWLQRHKDFNTEDASGFDLDVSHFTGETYKASLPRFKDRMVTGFDYTDQKFSGYIVEIKKQ